MRCILISASGYWLLSRTASRVSSGYMARALTASFSSSASCSNSDWPDCADSSTLPPSNNNRRMATVLAVDKSRKSETGRRNDAEPFATSWLSMVSNVRLSNNIGFFITF